jgi:hypothetical protein
MALADGRRGDDRMIQLFTVTPRPIQPCPSGAGGTFITHQVRSALTPVTLAVDPLEG